MKLRTSKVAVAAGVVAMSLGAVAGASAAPAPAPAPVKAAAPAAPGAKKIRWMGVKRVVLTPNATKAYTVSIGTYWKHGYRHFRAVLVGAGDARILMQDRASNTYFAQIRAGKNLERGTAVIFYVGR